MTELEDALARHGWLVVHDDGACSTVGLTAEGLPEVVVLGLPADVGGALLHEVAEHLLAGEPLAEGEPLPGLLDDGEPVLVPVESPPAGAPAVEVYGDDVRLLQLAWPDADGRLPWHPGFAHAELQPLLGRPPAAVVQVTEADLPAWPLEHDPHTLVLTSVRVAEAGAPVLVVVRDGEAGWRFLDGVSDFDPETAVVECLHDALARDLTLVDAVGPLGRGQAAERDAVGEPWELGDW